MGPHTILFIAANPVGTDQRALDEQARTIQVELERAGRRDWFRFETRWAARPLDLLREMVKHKPTVVHFCGGRVVGGANGAPRAGVYFQAEDGRAQLVSANALANAFDAAGSVKLVVLDACYSEAHATAVAAYIDCVVGITGETIDGAATSFAIGLYGGLGEGESVAAAFKQGCAAISMTGAGDACRPQLRVRPGVEASGLILTELRAARDHERVAHERVAAGVTQGGALPDGGARRRGIFGRCFAALRPTIGTAYAVTSRRKRAGKFGDVLESRFAKATGYCAKILLLLAFVLLAVRLYQCLPNLSWSGQGLGPLCGYVCGRGKPLEQAAVDVRDRSDARIGLQLVVTDRSGYFCVDVSKQAPPERLRILGGGCKQTAVIEFSDARMASQCLNANEDPVRAGIHRVWEVECETQ